MDEIIANIFIILMGVTLLATLAITIFSVYHSLKVNKRQKIENGVPVGLIGWGTVALLLIIALPTWLIGSFTDMCIITSLLMLLIACGTIVYGRVLSVRMRK